MDYERQQHAPIYEALERFRKKRVVPFDVPGHKRGRGNPELAQLLGEKCVGLDVNSMKPLDNLCHPVSVIREAEELAADAFGAAHAFLMVGGTTSAVQSMILSVCKAGDKIILPRNVHKSAINALVLCGAIPVYVNPEVDQRLGISLGMKREQVEKAIKEHPKAVAVLVNNPTYYGICSDLRAIVKMAHDAGMLCLADEAHGTHFYFGGGLPVSAMAAGADMAAVSMHKNVDPVGACVGLNGARVNAIVNDLKGEKIDIINWNEDPCVFIENALSPSKVVSVAVDVEEKSAEVVVPDYQLSLAIGKEGQNARLAARLTGYKIDIKSESQAAEEAAKVSEEPETDEFEIEEDLFNEEINDDFVEDAENTEEAVEDFDAKDIEE